MALAFVEGQVIDNGTGVATTPAFTNSFVTGQLVVITACFDGASDTTTSITDNATTHATYIKVTNASGLAGGAGTNYKAVYYAVWAATKASPTITVNFNSAATNCNVVVQYFNGFTGTPTLDVSATQANLSSTTVTSPTSSATAQATELVIGSGGYTGTVTTFSLGSGYTNLTQSNVANRAGAMESKVVSSTGTQVATFTLAVAKANGASVTSFYDAVAGATPTNLFYF